ncbi:MAG: DUF5694 domain-containing protein [Candidatus Poribacteria bacterium]|nr:DUF5694 domain-containing protein [Candidatus Poribacteria bacterium]
MKHQKKPTIMILGTTLLDNPGMDAFNYRMDDVLAPKRQREIEQLVSLLKPFHPNKIAIQADEMYDSEINANYQDYLNDTYKLQRSEVDQIGYRLAKQMEHPKIYCVDYSRRDDPIIPLDELDMRLIDVDKFAMENNQEHLLPRLADFTDPDVETHEEEDGRVWIEPKKYEPLLNMFIRCNEPEGRYADHRVYLRLAKIGIGDQYPGANWVGHLWYARNLKVYVNLTRITESAEDRILLLIGAGLVYLIKQFLEESGDYIVESPLKYLKPEDAN